MKRILIPLLVVLMIIAYSPPSLAITVDGVKSPGEWDEAWAFGQDRNGSHAAPVPPFGDRVEAEQGHGTGIINMFDPADDSGPNFDDTMATVGPYKSGFDLGIFYTHYDESLDTLYGCTIAYGKPGDLDGDDDIGEQCNNNGDCIGNPGPDGQTGIGPGETFTVQYVQGTAVTKIIIGQDNDVQVQNLDYVDVKVNWTTNEQPDGSGSEPAVEVSINNASNYFNLALGAEPIIVDLTAGGIRDIPGEDTARLTLFMPPCGKLGDYVWLDKDQDGIQDAGENGIANVQVDLYLQGTDTLVGSTTTNSNGIYLFECVSPMSCYDIVLNPSNFNPGGPLSDPNLTASPANVGGNDATDSDGINNRIDNRCLTPEDPVDLTNDFGFYVPPRVPGLTPFGLFVMAGLLGILGIIGIRMKR